MTESFGGNSIPAENSPTGRPSGQSAGASLAAAIRLEPRGGLPAFKTAYVIIPARLASTRLPRKLLLRETGKSLLQHTYEAALTSRRAAGIRVAVDHLELFAEVQAFGGNPVMTGLDCPSGTDRVAEVAALLGGAEIVVNLQGDEPELPGTAIDAVIELLERNPQLTMATLATPIRQRAQLEDPACVKVVFNNRGQAMYFSRSPIPAVRDWDDRLLTAEPAHFYQHIGVYAYRREFLLYLTRLPVTAKERLEKLEQLRVLDSGFVIAVGVINHAAAGIDTPDDYARFVARQRAIGPASLAALPAVTALASINSLPSTALPAITGGTTLPAR